MHALPREPRSLQEIEQDDWGDPPAETTRLITTVHRLRRVPIDQFDDEALRVMLGQRVGVPILVPRALTRLEEDPLREGDYYPGDVLHSVLRTPDEYWRTHRAELARLRLIVDRAELALRAEEFPVEGLLEELQNFRDKLTQPRA